MRRAAGVFAPANEHGPRFTFTNVLYYLGGMLAISAMSLFMTLGWDAFGGWGVFFIALLYTHALKVGGMGVRSPLDALVKGPVSPPQPPGMTPPASLPIARWTCREAPPKYAAACHRTHSRRVRTSVSNRPDRRCGGAHVVGLRSGLTSRRSSATRSQEQIVR